MSDVLSTLRGAFALLPGGTRRRWLALIPAAVVAALAEMAGAFAVLALVRALLDPASAAALPGLGAPLSPRQLALAVAAVFLLKGALAAAVAAWVGGVHAESVTRLSERVLEAYLRAPWTFHLERRSASLIHRAGRVPEEIARLALQPALALSSETLVIAAMLAALFLAAPLVTLLCSLALAALVLTAVRATRGAARRAGTELLRLEEESLAHLGESLGALKELRVLGRERSFLEPFTELARRVGRARARSQLFAGLTRPLIETVFVAGLVVAVWALSSSAGQGPRLVSLLGLFAYAAFRTIPSANRIVLSTHLIREAAPAVESLAADLALLDREAREELGGAGDAPAPTFATLELRDVAYAFDEGRRPALRGVSLLVRRGESIGIVGPTGAGKSTLLDVLLGLLPPAAGHVLADGRDVFQDVRAWRRRIGYVPQQPFLLDDTLGRNVVFGRGDVDQGKLREAVRLAQLGELVARLPGGLDAHVGERGKRLSGGERQRVVIARALYHEPELLVFDEATSSLDAETERELARALDALHGSRTMLVVAHRLETVRRCDRIVFLDRGRVEAEGHWDELLERSPGFQRMAGA